MIEIIFNDKRELASLEGKTVAEARKELGGSQDNSVRRQVPPPNFYR